MDDGGMRDSLLRFAADAYGSDTGDTRSDPGSVVLKTQTGRWFGVVHAESGVYRLDFPCGTDCSVVCCVRGIKPSMKVAKDDWASVVLDGSVRFNAVCELLEVAYRVASCRGTREECARRSRDALTRFVSRMHADERISAKVYSDTAIGGREAVSDGPVPERIREMRALFTDDEYRTLSEPVIFTRMAFFMEDYEDDRPYGGSFHSPFHTYRMMSDAQLRGYFTWRTAVRKGAVEGTHPSYAYTYVCELINGVGWKDPEDGFRMLKDFLDRYSEIDVDLFPYEYLWLSDFAACYGVRDISGMGYTPSEKAYLALSNVGSYSLDDIRDAVSAILGSAPDSKLIRTCPEDFWESVRKVLGDHGEELLDVFFRKRANPFYRMFPTAVFCDPGGREHYTYSVKGVADYICDGSVWVKTTYLPDRKGKYLLADIVRATDCLLRGKLGMKPYTVCPFPKSSPYLAYVSAAVDRWMEEKRIRSVPKVEIDTSRLAGIRTDAEAVMERIITSEEMEDDAEDEGVLDDAGEAENAGTAVPALSSDEAEFLRLVMDGGQWKNLLTEHHMMLSVIVDSINGKLYDRFGDTVLTDDPGIVEDYRQELEELVH